MPGISSGETGLTPGMRFVLGALGAAFVIAYIYAKYLSMAPDSAGLGPRHRSTAAGRDGNISVTTFVGAREIDFPSSRLSKDARKFPVEISIENHSPHTIVRPRWISFDLDGLENARAGCWGKLDEADLAMGPICVKDAPGWDTESLRLRPGGAVTFYTYLSACRECRGLSELNAVLGWALEPAGGASRTGGGRRAVAPLRIGGRGWRLPASAPAKAAIGQGGFRRRLSMALRTLRFPRPWLYLAGGSNPSSRSGARRLQKSNTARPSEARSFALSFRRCTSTFRNTTCR